MSDANTIRVNGRTYVTIREAARLVSYSRTYLYTCCRKGKLQVNLGKDGLIYVNRADVLRFAEQQQKRQSKWQQISVWWRDHPRERATIRNTKQFQRALAQAGLRCSLPCVRAWLARHAPRQYRVDAVVAWFEADSTRRRLSIDQARRDLFAQLRLDVHRDTIRAAWKKYDASNPPFDPAQYQAAKDAAVQWGVSPALITHDVRRGKLNGMIWNAAVYVRRAELQQRFGAPRLKRGQGHQRLRAWYQAHPVYRKRTLTAAQRAFFAETGLRLSKSLFCRVRQWARGQV